MAGVQERDKIHGYFRVMVGAFLGASLRFQRPRRRAAGSCRCGCFDSGRGGRQQARWLGTTTSSSLSDGRGCLASSGTWTGARGALRRPTRRRSVPIMAVQSWHCNISPGAARKPICRPGFKRVCDRLAGLQHAVATVRRHQIRRSLVCARALDSTHRKVPPHHIPPASPEMPRLRSCRTV